jgi:hypothetical protein
MSKCLEITWLSGPEDKDYPAAESYLSLLFEKQAVEEIVTKLK